MRWPWTSEAPPEPDPDAERRLREAQDAVAKAEQVLEDVQSRWSEINQRAEEMRRIRRENHLADLVRRNLRGRHA